MTCVDSCLLFYPSICGYPQRIGRSHVSDDELLIQVPCLTPVPGSPYRVCTPSYRAGPAEQGLSRSGQRASACADSGVVVFLAVPGLEGTAPNANWRTGLTKYDKRQAANWCGWRTWSSTML